MPIPLHSHASLLAGARSGHELRERIQSGDLTRVRRGVYADGSAWRTARPEERVVARARALQLTSDQSPLFSHETAAALLGLPLFRPDSRRSHVIVDDARPGAASATVRHRGRIEEGEVVVVDGLRCTTLVRTVADVARSASREQAAVVADAAVRRVSLTDRRRYDAARAACFIEEVLTCARRSAHGVARAERALLFADGRAELPGESISRLRLHEAGFRKVSLQVAVPGPAGTYYVDFGLDEADALGEFDGRSKYVDGHLTRDLPADEVLDREKRREDWIRGLTQRRFARWGWSDLETAQTLARRLAAFGIVPPERLAFR